MFHLSQTVQAMVVFIFNVNSLRDIYSFISEPVTESMRLRAVYMTNYRKVPEDTFS